MGVSAPSATLATSVAPGTARPRRGRTARPESCGTPRLEGSPRPPSTKSKSVLRIAAAAAPAASRRCWGAGSTAAGRSRPRHVPGPGRMSAPARRSAGPSREPARRRSARGPPHPARPCEPRRDARTAARSPTGGTSRRRHVPCSDITTRRRGSRVGRRVEEVGRGAGKDVPSRSLVCSPRRRAGRSARPGPPETAAAPAEP